MAYLDGELGDEDRMQVESLIESNSDHARLLNQWREHGELIRSMPKLSLDGGFAQRVLDAVEIGQSDPSKTEGTSPREAIALSRGGTHAGPDWRVGAVAIATLAAMLLLTLFVFPSGMDQPPVALNPDLGQAVIKSDATERQPQTESNGKQPKTVPLDTGSSRGSGVGPTKPLLNKSLEGQNRTPGSRDLVPPMGIIEQADSVDQVLWVDMKSHSTALADIEAVLSKNSITILRGAPGSVPANSISENPSHLIQRSNARFEALHVIAIRSQVKKAIVELSNQYQADVQAFAIPASPGSFPSGRNPEKADRSGDKGSDGKVLHNSRITGAPQTVGVDPGSATVQQLHPQGLVSRGSSENDPAQGAELRHLDEWFGLAEKEDALGVVRLLLLIDTSSGESNSPASDE